MAPLQAFLIASTCFLYLIAAGLFSKAVLLFELNEVSWPMICSKKYNSNMTVVEPLDWW
jgi:high-affinity Fe2+/Pb2+ permease